MKEEINFLSVLADSTRLKIIESLLCGERCVCEIIPFTKTKQSNVSIQLKKLSDSKIISSRKEGKKIFYKIEDYRVCELFKLLNLSANKVNNSECCKNC